MTRRGRRTNFQKVDHPSYDKGATMLKIYYPFLFLIGVGLLAGNPLRVRAQTVIGMGTDTPNPNAVLELVPENGNQGFLAPRLTSAQRTASTFTASLADADNGLLVFDIDVGQFFYWYQGEWRRGIAGSSDETSTGIAGTIWYTGTTAPSGLNATEGDFYINESTGEVYRFSGSAFAVLGSLSATTGPIATPTLSSVLQQNNSAGRQKIADIAMPTAPNDAATKNYVDQQISGVSISDTDDQLLSEILGVNNDASGNKIAGLADPVADQDAATKKYVDTQVNAVTVGSMLPLPNNQIYLGNTSNQPRAVTIQGDATIASDGTITISDASITTDMLENNAVTPAKIVNKAVTSTKIDDNAVNKDHIDASVAGNGLTQAGDGSLQVDLGGDVTTAGSDLTVTGLQGRAINGTVAPTNGQVLKWDDANKEWIPAPVGAGGGPSSTPLPAGAMFVGNAANVSTPTIIKGDISVAASGDVTTEGIQGNPVDASVPTNDQVLMWKNSKWTPTNLPAGGGGSSAPEVLSGGGPPAGANGKVGDIYVENNGNIYIKVKDDGNVNDRWKKLHAD